MTEKTVREIMTSEVMTLRHNDTLRLATDLMTLAQVRHFPVVDAGRLVGVVSQRGLFRASLTAIIKNKNRKRSARTVLGTVAVKDAMNEPATTISPDASIREAARIMVERHIGCLPVVDEGRLVGIVTETDFLKQIARL